MRAGLHLHPGGHTFFEVGKNFFGHGPQPRPLLFRYPFILPPPGGTVDLGTNAQAFPVIREPLAEAHALAVANAADEATKLRFRVGVRPCRNFADSGRKVLAGRWVRESLYPRV